MVRLLSADHQVCLTVLAVKFLLSHGFRMEGPFVEGVPYLSREEEELAYEIERSREDKGNIAEISIGEDDPEALSFLQRVRTQVLHWKDRKVVGLLLPLLGSS